MSLRCLSLVKSFRGNLCCAFKQQKYHHIARLNRNPYRYITAMAGTGINKTFDDIIKSEEDKRLYRGLELQNGLKILLISDPTTDKSSAAMDVNIGHMSDPKDIPGLAHFCEHMLFLGTEKYPVENEYSKYLSEHGGSSNAFTSAEHTNFYFDVAPENLDGALLRFAQFFLTPLFTPSATEREVNAVNSENDKNLMNDHWRLHQLEKATSNPDHDFHKFGTGNKDTLLELPKARGVDVRDELLKFHKKFYSSNIMALAVLGKESLEELTEMVVPLFDKVENKSVKVPEWPDHPFNAECLKIKAHIVPVKDLRNMNVTFPIPDLQDQYTCNPGHYLGHLIGHEGPGSLLSELKSRGWVNNLVGGQKEGAKGFMFFILNVDLSEEGIEHTDDIITLMFQYLNMLKKEGPQQWVFDECRDLNRMGFRFKDKEKPRNYTCNCSSLLHDYPMKEVLCGGYLMEEYKPEWIKDVLAHLLPEKIRIAVVGKKFDGHTNETEKWYGTNYAVAPIDEDLLKKWADAGFHEKLALPDKNEFIPTDFSIVEREEHLETAPKVVRDSSMIRMWFKQDDKFLLPKACINIEVTSPLAYMDPLSTNMSYMFVALLRDALNEYAYAAELAGISYDIHSTIYGLTLTVKGYHDKQHILLKKILEKMTTFEINTQRFDILKENYVRGLKNFQAEQPHQHAIYYTSVLMCEQLWTKDELLEACEELTVERLQGFMPQLLARLYIEMLVYGNVTKKRGNEIADIVQDILKTGSKTKPLLPSQQRRFREYQLPDGCSYVYKKNNDVHKSSSLEVYYQCNLQETHSNMVLELFCQIINEPCFDMLRTQEQLGYIVFSGVRRSNGVQGLRVIVQSDKVPEYVEKRIEAFLLKMKAAIEEMDDESFQKHVQALATRRMEKPKKLSGQNAKYWSEIITQWYNFDRDNVEVDRLKTLVKDDIVKFYNDNISYTAPKRHKVSVHVVSTAPDSAGNDTANGNGPSDGEPTVTDPVEICDVSLFKRGLGLFPLPKPFINVGSPNSKL